MKTPISASLLIWFARFLLLSTKQIVNGCGSLTRTRCAVNLWVPCSHHWANGPFRAKAVCYENWILRFAPNLHLRPFHIPVATFFTPSKAKGARPTWLVVSARWTLRPRLPAGHPRRTSYLAFFRPSQPFAQSVLKAGMRATRLPQTLPTTQFRCSVFRTSSTLEPCW